MPWIDPQKEVVAEEKAIAAGLKARSQSIRERGGNPQNTYDQIKQEREQDEEAGLTFTTGNIAASNQSTNENQGESDAKENKDDSGKEESGTDQSGDTDTDD